MEDKSRILLSGQGKLLSNTEAIYSSVTIKEDYKARQKPSCKSIIIIPNNKDKNEKEVPRVNPVKEIGRNDKCTCGSGKKFKKCCGEEKFIEAYKLIEQMQHEPQR